MIKESYRIGQRVLYTHWNSIKNCEEECEVEILWIYDNEKAEVRFIDRIYKVELVNLNNLILKDTCSA